MAIIIRDSFDFYATPADAGANFWDTFNTGVTLQSAVTRMGQGQAVTFTNSNRTTMCSKSFGNASTVFTAFAMRPTTLASPSITNGYDYILQYYDATTLQLSVCFRSNGYIDIYQGADPSGAGGGTLLQRFATAYPGNVWTHWQVKCIFNGATGEVHIRKNGNTSDDYAVTGVNTIKSANAYANKVIVAYGETAGAAIQRYIDDLAIWDSTGSAPWNDWIGDVRAIQVMPNADTAQKQFTAAPTTGLAGSNGTGQAWNPTGGNMVFAPWKAIVGGTLGTSITCHARSAITAHMVIGVYDSDGPNGQPGTRLAYSSPVTNPVAGDNIFTLGNTVTVVNGHTYYWMFETDATSGQLEQDNNARYNFYISNPGYSATPPASVSAQAFTVNSYQSMTMWGTITASNSGCVSDPIEDGTTTYVSDANVGDYDLYTTGGLTATPYAILGVTVRAFVAKSDAGARSGSITIKSSTTSQDSSALILSTSFLNLVMYQDTDPATGVAWTESGINAAELGPKVAA